MNFLYNIPAALLLVLAITFAIFLTAAGQTWVYRRYGKGDLLGHNEVGGIIIAVSGTIYAVILGFLTVVAWEHYQEARNLVVHRRGVEVVGRGALGDPAIAQDCDPVCNTKYFVEMMSHVEDRDAHLRDVA